MEKTCKGKICMFWEEKNGEVTCPFYINTIWKKENSHVPHLMDDCSHRRNTLMLIDYFSRSMGIKEDYDKQKEKYEEVLKKVGEVFEEMKTRNKILENKLGIEYKEINLIE